MPLSNEFHVNTGVQDGMIEYSKHAHTKIRTQNGLVWARQHGLLMDMFGRLIGKRRL